MHLFTLFYRLSSEMFEKTTMKLFSLQYEKEVLNLMVGGCDYILLNVRNGCVFILMFKLCVSLDTENFSFIVCWF